MTFKRSRWLALMVVATAAVGLLAAGWALATHFTGHVTSSGTSQISQTNQSSNASQVFGSATFSTLNGTSTTVVVPTYQTRLVNARWVGVAWAPDTVTTVCDMRIGAIKGASFTEFNPISSTQVLTTGRSGMATHAVERSRRLTAGTYHVVAQVKGGPGSCRVDDWHFAVQVIG